MLFLIDTDGNYIRLIKKNICRHQYGIVHQPHIDIIGVFQAFIFELRHAGKFPGIGYGIQYPG